MHRTSLKAGMMAAALVAGLALAAGRAATQPVTTLESVAQPAPATPIRHVVVLFQENVSFDHYFATYPHAENRHGETPFHAAPDTPTVNGLTEALLTHNPNSAQPQRLGPEQAVTCDMDHEYLSEQMAFDGGLMDRFVEFTKPYESACDPRGVMDYFDGNTVTALWNYAQHFAMSDNSFGTGFGPSTPGALNLVATTTYGAEPADHRTARAVVTVAGTLISDIDPRGDDCSRRSTEQIAMHGRTIGDLLSAAHVTWGWFQGGFRPTSRRPDGTAVCDATSRNRAGRTVRDYNPHRAPFQYYSQTANPHHLPPGSPDMIGRDDQANHQYDLDDFYTALAAGTLPGVAFVKAKQAQDGHAGTSDPLDEQVHLVSVINAIERSPLWSSTAVIIAYDDSDGWYDHVMPPILRGSAVAGFDAMNAPGRCGNPAPGTEPARCGYGPRLPLLVISPWARVNWVDNQTTDQSSIAHFIEDNWHLPRLGGQAADAMAGSLNGLFDFSHPRAVPLLLDPQTGTVAQ